MFNKGESPSTESVHITEQQFRQQVDIARDSLSETFQTSRPLLMLGYTPTQIGGIGGMLDSVHVGESADAKWNNDEFAFYKHYARFDASSGEIWINFSGNGDYQISGRLNDSIIGAEGLKYGSHPHLFILEKSDGKDISLAEAGRRIFRGEQIRHTSKTRSVLSRIPLIREMSQVKASYSCFYLDEQTKTDIVFYFGDNDYLVFKKIGDQTERVIYGQRQNVTKQQVDEAMKNQASSPVLFQLPQVQQTS